MLHAIVHPDPFTSKKVNYFANYYTFVVKMLGKDSRFEMDNILSLTEKVIYQLEYNSADKAHKYISNHWDNPLVDRDNKYFKEFYHYDLISGWIEDFKSHSVKDRPKWLEDNHEPLLKDLKRFKTYLKRYMFRKALNSIISFLQCVHEIKEHKEDLQHYTKLIAVDLYYERVGKADVLNVFRKILSNKHWEFPFSASFESMHKKNLKKAKEDFIESRDFVQQFQGIRAFLREKSETYFYLFRIGNIKCPENFYYTLGDVEFLQHNSKKVNKIKMAFDKDETIDDKNFFLEEYELYALAKFKVKGNTNPIKRIVHKVERGLYHINSTCSTSGFMDKKSYVVTKDFKKVGYHYQFVGDISRISQIEADNLISGNAFQYLSGRDLAGKMDFLKCEETYLDAKRDRSPDLLWQYFENLLGKPFQERLVNIVKKQFIEEQLRKKKFYVRDSLNMFNYDEKKLNLGFYDQRELVREIDRNEEFDYSTLKTITENEFFHDLVDMINAGINIEDIESYLYGVLTELREARNMIQHKGQAYQKSILKCWESSFPIVIIFRRVVINEMIDHPRTSLNNIFLGLSG